MDDLDVRLGEEPLAQTPGTVERYFIFKEGGDTSHEGASTSLDDDDEEKDLILEEELESTSNEDRKILL
jgi:hypothetical protein